MNLSKQSCQPDQNLRNKTLLAFLPSQIDTSKAIVVGTGQVIDISQMAHEDIYSNFNNGTWVYYEKLQPRRMLVSNNNWTVVSFSPRTRLVCIYIQTNSGSRMLNITLSQISPKF